MSTTTKDSRWIEEFVVSLRMREVPGPQIGDLVAEVEEHCAESGQEPQEAFGAARDYAATRAADVGARPSSAREWLRVLLPTFAGLGGFVLAGPVTAAFLENTSVPVSWGQLGADAAIVVLSLLLVRFGEPVMTHRGRFAVVLAVVFAALMFAPIVFRATAFALPAGVAAVACGLLLVVSVWGAMTWARVDADPVTVPWTGEDRYAGTREDRLATFALRLQPWLFVIASVVWVGCTVALHASGD